jgi:hypothetical protein
LGWKDLGILAAKGVNGKADILKHEALKQAGILGQSV